MDRAVDDYLHCLERVYPLATYLTVNISSPNTGGLRDLQQEDTLRRLINTLREKQESLASQHGLRKPLLINCARGGLVNEADLVTALDKGQIAGAGFDCLTSEPPRPDNPLLAILGRPNVIDTPHTAWASDEAMQGLWHQVIEHIENFAAGSPSNRVQ